MSLAMFKDSPTQALRKIENDLRSVRPDIDFRRYFAMTPHQISEKIERLRDKNRSLTESRANRTWLLDANYLYRKSLIEGLEIVRDLRSEQEDKESLQPGMVYYAGTMQFGNTVTGRRCMVREGHDPCWVNFTEKVAVQKALEVLRYGNEQDFRVIYMEQANGRPDCLQNIDLDHVRESSEDALSRIEAYCDERWEGPWPWELRSSMKLQSQIEEVEMIKKQHIVEMQANMNAAIARLYEGEMDKYEVIAAIMDMIGQVDSMIKNLGKLSSAGIEATASARAFVGDEVGGQIEGALSPVLTQAAQSLSSLKAQLENTKQQIEQADGASMGMQGGQQGGQQGGGLGMGGAQTPGDAMGAAPPMGGIGGQGDDLSADMSDVDLAGSPSERGMKDI